MVQKMIKNGDEVDIRPFNSSPSACEGVAAGRGRGRTPL